eukprot:gnl/TRDRNA2_/TRDRNA2_162680_c0_seq2.p1 gnl/TRDRNA2_/TRDRNA2_162680_c0~~gnl/TRDRNA2_/TRDRNA2_162680_c0_seq2.p1  ORF type:complete len:182 (+),score=25.27 gnl/TRDRNA2_/TRDRNA2_162680_c0_seq2:52-546(+)
MGAEVGAAASTEPCDVAADGSDPNACQAAELRISGNAIFKEEQRCREAASHYRVEPPAGACGKAHWVAQRARWLDVPEEEVSKEPESFEDHGSLGAYQEAKRAQASNCQERACPSQSHLDLSDDEREMLEDCLDSTERPYPPLKRSLPLVQAIRCAEEIWAEAD